MSRNTGLVVVLVAAIVLVLLRAPATLAGKDDLAITVVSRMLADTMTLFCQESKDSAYDIDITLDYNRFTATTSIGPVPQVQCKWMYQGNYMKGVVLYDQRWPEAAACRRRNGGCTIVFENEVMSIVTPAGKSRVLGDVAVKRCKKWLIITIKCTYPPHKHRYVGQVLSNWLQFFLS